MPNTRLPDEVQEFSLQVLHTRRLYELPKFNQLGLLSIIFWFIPVKINIIKLCVTCLTSILKHISKVQGIEFNYPSGNPAHPEVMKVINHRPSDSYELGYTGNIKRIKPCVVIMRTFFSAQEQWFKRIVFSLPRPEPRLRRRDPYRYTTPLPGLPDAAYINPIKECADILRTAKKNLVQSEKLRLGIYCSRRLSRDRFHLLLLPR